MFAIFGIVVIDQNKVYVEAEKLPNYSNALKLNIPKAK